MYERVSVCGCMGVYDGAYAGLSLSVCVCVSRNYSFLSFFFLFSFFFFLNFAKCANKKRKENESNRGMK